MFIGSLDRTPLLWLDRVTALVKFDDSQWLKSALNFKLNFLTNNMKTKENSDLFASDFPLSAGYMDLINVSLKIIFQSILQRAEGLG